MDINGIFTDPNYPGWGGNSYVSILAVVSRRRYLSSRTGSWLTRHQRGQSTLQR